MLQGIKACVVHVLLMKILYILCWQKTIHDSIVIATPALTVAIILFTAAADRSSPLGWSTSVMPRWRRLKVMPSKIISLVSVQFSGSSLEKKKKKNKQVNKLVNSILQHSSTNSSS